MPQTRGDPLYLPSQVLGLQMRQDNWIIINILDYIYVCILRLYIVTGCTIGFIRYILNCSAFPFITYMCIYNFI